MLPVQMQTGDWSISERKQGLGLGFLISRKIRCNSSGNLKHLVVTVQWMEDMWSQKFRLQESVVKKAQLLSES